MTACATRQRCVTCAAKTGVQICVYINVPETSAEQLSCRPSNELLHAKFFENIDFIDAVVVVGVFQQQEKEKFNQRERGKQGT